MAGQITRATLEIQYGDEAPYEVDGAVKEFAYASDVLAVGDLCTFTLVNEGGRLTDKLVRGSTVRLYLTNPEVNGGARTLKHLGVIVRRGARIGDGTISVTSADLGWHLKENSAPLWWALRKGTFADLVDPAKFRVNKRGGRFHFIDPSWGIKGVRADGNVLNRRIKLGRVGLQQQYDITASITHPIQAEAGEAVFDIQARFAQRFNLLVNVSVDGYIQTWNPDYTQAPLYSIEVKESGTNVLDGELAESIESMWTDIECVGESLNQPQDMNDPLAANATHRRGAYYAPSGLLPFRHRLTFADSERVTREAARKQAEWKYRRGLWDALFAQYVVEGHHQGGVWWESDTMAMVSDEILGIAGPFYVASVQCESTSRDGDRTTIVVRKPDLLSAAAGEWGARSSVKSSKKKAKGTAK